MLLIFLSRFPGLHTVTNTYILNLAIADEFFLLGIYEIILNQYLILCHRSSICDNNNDIETLVIWQNILYSLSYQHHSKPGIKNLVSQTKQNHQNNICPKKNLFIYTLFRSIFIFHFNPGIFRWEVIF